MENYDTPKYFLNFTIYHLNVSISPIKLCLEFSIGETIYTKMKEIDNKNSPSRHL